MDELKKKCFIFKPQITFREGRDGNFFVITILERVLCADITEDNDDPHLLN